MVYALLDLVLPGGCVACSAAEAAVLCLPCRETLTGPAYPTRPVPAPPGLPVIWTMSSYDGVARTAILAHKEHGRVALARPLGNALAIASAAVVGGQRRTWPADLVLVPMPSRAAAIRARGQDPMRCISRRAVDVLRASGGGADLLPLLRPRRRVMDQAGLDSAARAANLHGALVVPGRFEALLAGRPTLIVDDVVTTGASLAEATRALRGAGADVLGAAVIAATARRGYR